MLSTAAISIARQFVDSINAHDVEAMLALMTPDHRLIDSLGNLVAGREKMQAAWRGYFTMVPDYKISIDAAFAQGDEGDEVILCGVAGGTYAPGGKLEHGNAWRTPVALRAKIKGDLIEEWRVYADNEPLREKMRQP